MNSIMESLVFVELSLLLVSKQQLCNAARNECILVMRPCRQSTAQASEARTTAEMWNSTCLECESCA